MDNRYIFTVPEGFDAFSYAHFYVDQLLLPDVGVVAENRKWLGPNLEFEWFRPSVEIQVAGLSLMAGRLGAETFSLGLACSAIDHLLVGWNSLLLSFPRVAYTLSRHVVEASIFEVADTHSRVRFRELWQADKATGGKVLNLLQKTDVPPALLEELRRCWQFAVSFGHVSPIPSTMAAGVGPQVAGTSITAQVLGGPHNGQLPEGVLLHSGGTLAMIAEGSLSAFEFTFRERLAEDAAWSGRLRAHRQRIQDRLSKKKSSEDP